MPEDSLTPPEVSERPAYQPYTPKPGFEIGRVLGRGFNAIRDHWKSFLVTSLLFVGLPMIGLGLLPLLLGMTGGLEGSGARNTWVAGSSLMGIGSLLVMLIGGVILQAALTYASLKAFNNETPDMRQSVSVGLQLFWPLIGMSIVIGIGIMLGIILLIIPGVILAIGWSVATPALVMERKGLSEALSRSWKLTEGYRWWILLYLIIITVIGMVVGAILGVIPELITPSVEVMMGGASMSYVLIYAIITALSQAITVMINAITAASLYYEVRDLKEGVSSEALASIFD